MGGVIMYSDSAAMPPSPSGELTRELKTILFADVVDSVRLMQAHENRVIRQWLDFIRDLKTSTFVHHKAVLVNQSGDGLLLQVDHPAAAAHVAFEMMDLIRERNQGRPQSERIDLRIGINIGDIVSVPGQDIYGHEVNVAARLLSLANPGEIVATARVRDALSSELDAKFRDLGDCFLKNVSGTVRVFKMLPRDAVEPVSVILSEADLLPTVAVIPFFVSDPATDHYAAGEVLADNLISALSRSGNLNVISRLSTTAFRMRKAELSEIGAALAADYVVSGSYRGDERRIVLDLELAEVRTGFVLAAERIDEEFTAILRETEVTVRLVEAINRNIIKRQVTKALSRPLPTLENYSLLMSATSLMHRLSPSDFKTAYSLLDSLIERAPRQPAPLAALARWHVLRVMQGWSDSAERDAALAKQCTQRALDLDPENVSALVAEGFVLTNLMRQLDEAERTYNLALDISPNDASGRLLRGTLYAFRGEGTAATNDTERAMHLTPLDPHRFFFLSLAASACIAAENYPRALELADQSLRMNRMHTSTLRVKTVAEQRLGMAEKARETTKRLLELQPNLTVGNWLRSAPSAGFPVGQAFAQTLKEAGIPT